MAEHRWFAAAELTAEDVARLSELAEMLWEQRTAVAREWATRLVSATPEYFNSGSETVEQLEQVNLAFLTLVLEHLRNRDLAGFYDTYYGINRMMVEVDLQRGVGPRISLESLYVSVRVSFEVIADYVGRDCELLLAYAKFQVQLMALVGSAYSDCHQQNIRNNEQLRASLRAKDLLLKEIHHRIKNNLQVISSLLGLQSRLVHDPRDTQLFRESQNRVRLVAIIHEALHKSDNLSHFDGGAFIYDITSHLMSSYAIEPNTVELEVDVRDVHFGLDIAVPCGMIINELVSNALLHGFAGGRRGRVEVHLRSADDDAYQLRVSDTGAGLPPHIDFCNPTSLGWQLVNALTEQLGGSIEVHSDHGTEFILTFPREPPSP